jgi:hypothetical protein
MKGKNEHSSIEISIPWSLDLASDRKSTILEISGHAGFLRTLLPQLITAQNIRHPELGVGNKPLHGMIIGHAVSFCGQRLMALGWKLFHAEFVSHFSDFEPEVMRLVESAYFLGDDPNRSLTIQELASHLGWKAATVRKWAKQASKLGVISIEPGNRRSGGEKLKVCMYLAALSNRRDRQLEGDEEEETWDGEIDEDDLEDDGDEDEEDC